LGPGERTRGARLRARRRRRAIPVSSARERLWEFVRLNQRLSARARPMLVGRPEQLAERYLHRIATLMDEHRPEVAVDVGGGRSCLFAARRPEGTRIVAVDVAAGELALND